MSRPDIWVPEKGHCQAVDVRACTFPIDARHMSSPSDSVRVAVQVEGGPMPSRQVTAIRAKPGPTPSVRVHTYANGKEYRGTREGDDGATCWDGRAGPAIVGEPRVIPWDGVRKDWLPGDQNAEVWREAGGSHAVIGPSPQGAHAPPGRPYGLARGLGGSVRGVPEPPPSRFTACDLFCGMELLQGPDWHGRAGGSRLRLELIATYGRTFQPGFPDGRQQVDRVVATVRAQPGAGGSTSSGSPPCTDFRAGTAKGGTS